MFRRLAAAAFVLLLVGGGSSLFSDEPLVVPVLQASDEDACDIHHGAPHCDDGTRTGTVVINRPPWPPWYPSEPATPPEVVEEAEGYFPGYGTEQGCEQRGTCDPNPFLGPRCRLICVW